MSDEEIELSENTQKKSTKGTMDMTTGNSKLLILRFALPVFISQLFQQLYNTADSVIVGRFLGKSELAAVSSSGNLIFLINSFFIGISVGAGVVIAKYFGAKDERNVSRAIHTDFFFGLMAGLALTAFGVLATPTILRWMKTDEEVLPYSILYFRYYFLGALGMILYNIQTGIMNAVGDSKRPLVYLIISSCLNVTLDILFIAVLHKGVQWAAIATVISQTTSAVLCLIHLVKPGRIYQLQIRKIRPHADMMKEILKNGIPTGVQNSVIGFANVLVQSNINTFGEDAMAGYGSYAKVEGFAFLPITCFSMALSTFVSQNLGAKKPERAKEGARFGIIACLILAEIIGILMYVFAPTLIGFFNEDPEVIRYGVLQARTVDLFCFLLAFSHVISGICRGAGKAFVPMIVMLSVWCVLRITYITIAMQIDHNIQLLFWAYPLTWSISSIIFLIYYKKSNWLGEQKA